MTTDESAERARALLGETLDKDFGFWSGINAKYRQPVWRAFKLLDDAHAAALRAAEQPAPEKGETKETTINMRVASNTLALIDNAAHTLGLSRSQYLRQVAQEEAEKVLSRQPSHPADAGSGEDATTAHGIFDEVLVERLRTYPPEKAHVRTAATRILQLNRDLSAAREQTAAEKALTDFWKAASRTSTEVILDLRAERDAARQEVARAYEECAKIVDKYKEYHGNYIAEVIRDRAASLARAGDSTPETEYTHRHGGRYVAIGEAKIQTDVPLKDYDAVVVYRARKDGTLWVRRYSEFLDRFQVIKHSNGHDLYVTGDPGVPDVIKDSNGEVVLGLCRTCGKAESELDQPCIGARK